MTLDLNKKLKDLDGKDLEETIGKIVASALVADNKGDALKYYDWAVKLNKCESINVDKSDLKKIREFVENNERFTNLLKAQAYVLIDETKEVKE